MEVLDIIFIILTLGGLFIGGIFATKFSGIKRKKPVKTVETENVASIVKSYENSMEILKTQNDFLMQDSKTTKKRLAAEIGINLRNNESEQQQEIKINSKNLEEHYEIDITNGVKLVESMNLPFLNTMDKSKIPELLNNPMIKGKVWKYIKENKDEMISLGVIIPKGQLQQTQTKETKQEEKPNKNDGMMNLQFDESNSEYMA